MKKIFLLDQPNDHLFASFAYIGNWEKFRDFCKECTAPASKLVEPLQIEWEPSSDLIGDFSWCGFTAMVLPRVKEFLINNGFECRFGKVEVLKNTSAKIRDRIVQFPYTGPELNWLIPKKRLNLDIEKSGLKVRLNCSVCGLRDYKFRMDGIVILSSEWNGEKIFRIEQFGLSAATFVTETALHDLLSYGFSNLAYKEAGYIK